MKIIQITHNCISDRIFFIHANLISSAIYNVTTGVPQGYVMEPVLFFLYINNIPNLDDYCVFNT